MKCCLIHEMLGCIYAHLVLEVGLCDLVKSFHNLYLYIENFWSGWDIKWDIASCVLKLDELTELNFFSQCNDLLYIRFVCLNYLYNGFVALSLNQRMRWMSSLLPEDCTSHGRNAADPEILKRGFRIVFWAEFIVWFEMKNNIWRKKWICIYWNR